MQIHCVNCGLLLGEVLCFIFPQPAITCPLCIESRNRTKKALDWEDNNYSYKHNWALDVQLSSTDRQNCIEYFRLLLINEDFAVEFANNKPRPLYLQEKFWEETKLRNIEGEK